MADTDPVLRIGALSRRVEVEPALLRAWEKRYGLLQPQRSEGNFRLYSLDDVARVWAMKGHLARGMAAAEAARLALAEAPPRSVAIAAESSGLEQVAEELREALMRLDGAAAHAVLDQAFALNSLEDVLMRIILPCLRAIGDGWERETISVAQEHFASGLLRGRLLTLSRDWSSGAGKTAVLACLPGEQHDIGLMCFGLILWRQGWRIIYVGQDTPPDDLRRTVSAARPDVVVIATMASDLFRDAADGLRSLSAEAPLAIAGVGASEEIASQLDAIVLDSDLISAAETVGTIVRD
jgi:methanogenic corrinoid protein MtbC1